MEIEEILKYSSARIIVNETDYGSGVLFSHPSIQEYVYIISTYHCFKNYDKSDPKVWVTIESTVENQFLIKKYNQILFDEPNDISVIIFNRQDFDNVYLDNFEMLARNEKPAPRSSLSFRGYPLAYKHLMAQVMRGLYLETLSANTFTIESLTPIATFESPEIDIIPGFSGSGIFIESEYGVKLIGIITKYMGAFNNIKCAGFSSTLNKLLSQYQYPIISMLDTPEIEVVDQYFCIENKPEIPVPEIDRKNIVTIVINRLNSGNNIVFIQGDNGLGKTNLVSQFIRNYRDSSIAYFIDPCHNKSYDYENILKNFSDQIHFLLKKKLLIDELRTDYDSYDFRSYVQNSSLRLKRLASKRCIYIY